MAINKITDKAAAALQADGYVLVTQSVTENGVTRQDVRRAPSGDFFAAGGAGTALVSGQDLKALQPGGYYCGGASVAATLVDAPPVRGSFRLLVARRTAAANYVNLTAWGNDGLIYTAVNDLSSPPESLQWTSTGRFAEMAQQLVDLKSALNDSFLLDNYTWVLGSMTSGTGAETSDTKRVRSEYIPVNGGEIITVSGNEKCLIVYCFTSAKAYVSDSAWNDGNVFNVPTSGVGFVRILIRKSSSNDVMTDADIPTQVARCRMNKIIPQVTYSLDDELESIKSNASETLNRVVSDEDKIFMLKTIESEQSTGQIYYVSGLVGTSTSYKHTDYIHVTAGETYRFTGVLSGTDNNASGVVGYDSSKEYSQGLVGKKYSTRTLYENVEFVIPNGVAYIRACSAVTGTASHEIELYKVMIDSFEQKVTDAQADTIRLDIAQYNGIQNAYTAKKNFAESSTSTRWKNNLNYLPSFIHCSDFHMDAERFGRAAKIADYLGVDGLICSGDMVNSPDDDYAMFISKAGSTPYFPCIGNHESRNKTEQFIHDKFIAPLDGSVVFPQDVTYPTYYYKDFSDKSIRLITVDQYQPTSSSGSSDKINFTQEQITWFINTLLSTPVGYGVVVEMHTPEETPVLDSNYPKFKQTTLYYWPISPYKVLSEIVDAFISGTTLVKTYSNTSGATPATFDVNADFSEKNTGVEFIAFVCGHLHCDNITYMANTTNKQLLLNIACGCAWTNRTSTLAPGTNYPYFCELSDLGRAEEGPNQDAVNLYVIDRVNKSVRVVRIGADLTYDLATKRDYMVIPYAD